MLQLPMPNGIANTSKEYSANIGPNLTHNMPKENTYSESYIPVHNTEFQLKSDMSVI